jgi:hypothetical protein
MMHLCSVIKIKCWRTWKPGKALWLPPQCKHLPLHNIILCLLVVLLDACLWYGLQLQVLMMQQLEQLLPGSSGPAGPAVQQLLAELQQRWQGQRHAHIRLRGEAAWHLCRLHHKADSMSFCCLHCLPCLSRQLGPKLEQLFSLPQLLGQHGALWVFTSIAWLPCAVCDHHTNGIWYQLPVVSLSPVDSQLAVDAVSYVLTLLLTLQGCLPVGLAGQQFL